MKRFVITALAILILTSSCGKEAKKATQDSVAATEAFAVVEKMRDVYTKRDMKAVEAAATREGYRTISSSMKRFDGADLTFNPTLVEIKEGKTLLHVVWKGKWINGAAKAEERGTAVFVLSGKPLKVDNILRSNPFRFPE